MSDIEITIRLPEALAREAQAFGLLSSERIESLLRDKISEQLAAMAYDPEVQNEIAQMNAEFEQTESDGLEGL